MRGEVVVSNVQFNWPAVESYCKGNGCDVPRANYRYVDSSDLEHGIDPLLAVLSRRCMLLLDEIHLFVDSRNYQSNAKTSGKFQELLTQARKLEIDVWLISQAAANVDARLVRQATFIVRVSNWLHFPIIGNLFPFPVTVARVCAPDGKTVYARDWIWRAKKIGRLYDTKQTFKEIALGGEGAAPVRGKKRRKLGYGVVLVGAGLCCFALHFYLDRERYDNLEAYKSRSDHAGYSADRPKTVTNPGAETSSAPSSAFPALPVEIPHDSLLEFEATLPAVVSVHDSIVYLENGRRLTIGTPLGQGYVRSWLYQEGGCLRVLTNSPVTPEIRFYERTSNPYLCYSDGSPWRRGARRAFGRDPILAQQSDGMVSGSGVTTTSGNPWLHAAGAQGELGPEGRKPVYEAPSPVYVPPSRGLPARIPVNPWIE